MFKADLAAFTDTSPDALEKMPLRDRNKVKKRLAILAATRELLLSDGGKKVTIEAIAERAEVGVATVFNYFGTKNDLFIDLVHQDMARMLEKMQQVLADPPQDPIDAIVAAIAPSFELDLIRLSPSGLHEFMNDFWNRDEDTRKQSLRDILQNVEQYIEELLVFFQERKLLSKDLDTAMAASIVFSLIDYNHLCYARGVISDVEAMSELTRNQIRMLARQWVP